MLEFRDVPIHAMFKWQDKLFAKCTDTTARELGGLWTHEVIPCWKYIPQHEDNFNPFCPVELLK